MTFISKSLSVLLAQDGENIIFYDFYIFLVKYKYIMYISVPIPRCWLPASEDSVKYLKYENKYVLRSKDAVGIFFS